MRSRSVRSLQLVIGQEFDVREVEDGGVRAALDVRCGLCADRDFSLDWWTANRMPRGKSELPTLVSATKVVALSWPATRFSQS
jgi:hypothetical protein